MIDGLCQRWGQAPSAIYGESAHVILQMLALGVFAEQPMEAQPDPMREMLLQRAEPLG